MKQQPSINLALVDRLIDQFAGCVGCIRSAINLASHLQLDNPCSSRLHTSLCESRCSSWQASKVQLWPTEEAGQIGKKGRTSYEAG